MTGTSDVDGFSEAAEVFWEQPQRTDSIMTAARVRDKSFVRFIVIWFLPFLVFFKVAGDAFGGDEAAGKGPGEVADDAVFPATAVGDVVAGGDVSHGVKA